MKTLAQELWRCRKYGGTIEAPVDGGPSDLNEALAIQREAIKCSGLQSVGFKVGSTSLEAQKILGTTEPGSSPVLDDFFHNSPAKVLIYPSHAPAVEGEFAVRLACDLPPREEYYNDQEISNAIAAIAGAIEVVGSRWREGLTGKGRLLTTADFGANVALIVGEWTTNWTGINLKNHSVIVSANGVKCAEGTGAEALGHPFNVVKWLANKQSQIGRGLFAGEVISTGTCTGLLSVNPNDNVSADFGRLGCVEVQFRD